MFPTKDPSLTDVVNNMITVSKNYRQVFEPRWYVSYNAYENNHFVVWLPESRQIRKIPIRGNKFFNQIPELTKQIDTVENMLLTPEIIPIVYPVNMDEPSMYWAKKIGDYLMYLYKHWFFLGTLHDAVHDALVMPVSYFQLLPPETNNGKMDLLEIDAFDAFVPPGIKDVQSPECNYFGKNIRLPISIIQNDQSYNSERRKVRGTGKFSTSTYKDMIMSERYSNPGGDNYVANTSIINELWLKEKQKDGKVKIRVTTECEGMILRNELTSYDRLPFVSLKLHQGVLYQPSFAEYLLPINRGIDLFQSRMEDFGLKMVRGALMAPYGAGITRTTDENGEIVYYKGQMKPEPMPIPEIPPFFSNYINMSFGWMERYGASAVTMGASPKGMKTYRTVEAVRQQDYASQKTPMDFMKIALTQLFNLVVYFASIYYLEPVGIKIYEQEDYNTFDILGEKGLQYNMDAYENANHDMTKAPVVVHPDNVVEIEFETAQSYTMEGKRQTIYQAVEAGLLAKEDAIRMLKLGNVRDIMENLEKQAQEEMQQEAQKLAMQQQANGTNANGEQPAAKPPPNAQTPTPATVLGEQSQPAPSNPGIHVGG
jgi:hypothetical protein